MWRVVDLQTYERRCLKSQPPGRPASPGTCSTPSSRARGGTASGAAAPTAGRGTWTGTPGTRTPPSYLRTEATADACQTSAGSKAAEGLNVTHNAILVRHEKQILIYSTRFQSAMSVSNYSREGHASVFLGQVKTKIPTYRLVTNNLNEHICAHTMLSNMLAIGATRKILELQTPF